MISRLFKVADHVFSIRMDGDSALQGKVLDLMDNYAPFAIGSAEGESRIFELTIHVDQPLADYEVDVCQDEEGQQIYCGHCADGSALFEFCLNHKKTGQLICNGDYAQSRLLLTGCHSRFALDNALMVQFALATARMGTALFHGAVVCKDGKGYMFLGKSGTGKSTHARLWLNHVENTELVNDDNPVVRVKEDGAWVYGSPWSGKTPCYRNLKFPLGGAVLLSQAPYNRIRRLKGVEAYAAILPGISGMRWDRSLADGLHRTENDIAMKVPMWYLECLPDEAAAQLCFSQIAREK